MFEYAVGMEGENVALNELQQLQNLRKRFFDVLWNYSVIVDPETSHPTSVTSQTGAQAAQAIFPYRCA